MSEVLIQVFSNPLIWETLCSYIGYRDLLELRMVNKLFLQQITECPIYKDRLYLKIYWNCLTGRVVIPTSAIFNLPLPTTNLKVVLLLQDKIHPRHSFSTPQSVLAGAKRLKLTILGQDGDPTGTTRYAAINNATTTVLNNCPQLESLSMLQSIFNTLQIEALSDNTKARLRTLKEFVIYYIPSRTTERGDQADLIRNLEFISKSVTGLKTLVITKNAIPSPSALGKYIATLVENNSGSLMHLQILQDTLSSHVPFGRLHIPKLKRLALTADYSKGQEIATFLDRQDPLENLCLNFKKTFPASVYQALGTKCSKLRKLEVKSKSMETPGINWEFLATAAFLEQLSIKQPYSYGAATPMGQYHLIANNLGQNLKAILLRGLPGNGPLNLSGWNLPNLVELRMLRCSGSFTDQTLQYLSAYSVGGYPFPKLAVLEVSCCNGVTNNGVNCLSSRTKLRHLTIKQCPSVTDGALNRLHFPELKVLDVSSNPKVSRAGITNAVARHSKLEVLRTSWRVGREVKSIVGSSRFVRLLFVDDKSGKHANDSDSDADQQSHYDSDEGDYFCYDSD